MKFLAVQPDQTLAFENRLRPITLSHECLIAVRAFGVNRADLLQKAGKYPSPPGDSDILGLEVCGDIIAIGDKVTDWKIGDRVFGLVAGGGYAEYAIVVEDHLMKLPKDFSYAMGAAAAEAYLTAFQSLFHIAKSEAHHRVLIHAGASGVGSAAIQLAKLLGCQVTVTVGSDIKADFCKTLGADHVINYQRENFVEWQKTQVPEGFDVIIDVVAGNYISKNIQVAALDAHIVTLAILGGRYCENLDMAKMLMKRITLSASTLRNRSDQYKKELVAAFWHKFALPLTTGKLMPAIDECADWTMTNQLHEKMANNYNMGKLVLTISSTE